MKKMTLEEIGRAVDALNIRGDLAKQFSCVSTDSRTLVPGCLFVALRGERFDAHDFVAQVVAKGAEGVILERPLDLPEDYPALIVQDTLLALQKLAAYNRSLFQGPVIAITGSNGKTTTKDMVASVLGQKFKVLKTVGNFNNEIGLPLTILNMDESVEAAVLEMGMRGLGEIDFLAKLAGPTAGIITNIGESHLERLGSVENIAMAKTELLPHIKDKGYVVLNGDDPWLVKYAHRGRGKIIFYGMEKKDNVTDIRKEVTAIEVDTRSGEGTEFTVVGRGQTHRFSLPVPGIHNVYNALAAICIGLEEGLTWEQCIQGIKEVTLTAMRLQIMDYQGIRVINDTYNANPASTIAALDILAGMQGSGRRIAVLGDMFELGDRAEEGHREVARVAVQLGIDYIVAVGQLSVYIANEAHKQGMEVDRIISCQNNKAVLEYLTKILQPGDRVLVKGSRGMKMEEIVRGITGA